MKTPDSKNVREVATAWVVRAQLAPLTASETAELEAWLQASPHHRGAYIRANAVRVTVDRIASMNQGKVPSGAAPAVSYRRHSLYSSRLTSPLLAAGVAALALAVSWKSGYDFRVDAGPAVEIAAGPAVVPTVATPDFPKPDLNSLPNSDPDSSSNPGRNPAPIAKAETVPAGGLVAASVSRRVQDPHPSRTVPVSFRSSPGTKARSGNSAVQGNRQWDCIGERWREADATAVESDLIKPELTFAKLF